MNSSNSNSKTPLPVKERRRTPMACTNCRLRKLKCRPQSADNAPCERCVKEGVSCEYRPVDTSSTSSNHASNYSHQDNPPVNLYPINSAPPPSQEFVDQQQYVATPGGYVPNPFNPAVQAPFQPNLLYPTSPYQPHPSSYPVPQYSYPNTFPSEYSIDHSNYQSSSSQFGGHPPDPYMTYPPVHGHGSRPYDDHRGYPPFNGYENMDGSNSAKE